MKAELLKILREAEGFVSGQQLSEHFGVSRTAVWKIVGQLREDGYKIEAVTNKGYRIQVEPEALSSAEIESRLHTRWMGRDCIYLKRVDSTNNYVKRIAEQCAPEGTLVVAAEQTDGRGRRGKNWYTPKGEQIAMSLLLRPKIRPGHAARMTLLMAMAVTNAIRQVANLEAEIKWPNDVVVNGKKVCGILTEMSTEVTCINYVVIGVGINVNQKKFPEELNTVATSLRMELGRALSRAEIIGACMDELERLYDIFMETEDMSKLKTAYNAVCANRGHLIRVMEPGNEYTGTTDGINELGELVVKKEDGTITQVYAGEVSVRGLYGYT